MAETIAKVTMIFSGHGPLPVGDSTGKFSTSGGSLLCLASGTGYTKIPDVNIGMSIVMNHHRAVGPNGPNILIGNTEIFSNLANTHLAFPSMFLWRAPGVAAGNYDVRLETITGTTTDLNDLFYLTIIEMQP